jgi:hypothetical protein
VPEKTSTRSCSPSHPLSISGLLGDIPWQQFAAGLLDQLEFFPTEIAIHRDPVYMPARPWQWSAYNPILDGEYCEASVWYGALRPVENSGTPLSVFKSWATARAQDPQQEICRRAFLHPLITPKFIGLQRLVQLYQGLGGVWFAGSWLREPDTQETALLSAMDVVGELFAPLHALQQTVFDLLIVSLVDRFHLYIGTQVPPQRCDEYRLWREGPPIMRFILTRTPGLRIRAPSTSRSTCSPCAMSTPIFKASAGEREFVGWK